MAVGEGWRLWAVAVPVVQEVPKELLVLAELVELAEQGAGEAEAEHSARPGKRQREPTTRAIPSPADAAEEVLKPSVEYPVRWNPQWEEQAPSVQRPLLRSASARPTRLSLWRARR